LLYGLTEDEDWADYATLFKLNKDGTGYAVRRRFEGAAELPASALIEASDGALYGTTFYGGIFGKGTVFRLNKDGSGLTNIYHFSSPPDWWMPAGVMEGSDGALYGTSWYGGDLGNGAVFTLNRDGTGFRVLASFPYPPGACSGTLTSPLCEGSDGALYGTELGCWGRPMEAGTVFKLNKDGTDFGVLHRFQSRVGEGQHPSTAALVNAGDGALYGVTLAGGASLTNGPGTVFKLNRDGTGYSIPYRFQTSSGDGSRPVCLIEGRDGALYGVTEDGGEFGAGTLFCLEVAPVLYNPVWTSNVFSFQFNTRSNVVYQPQFKTSLADSNWIALPSITGQRGAVTVTDTNLDATPRFYRVTIP
jgi:uncharacterized repeat protein (TIGR03803 family)